MGVTRLNGETAIIIIVEDRPARYSDGIFPYGMLEKRQAAAKMLGEKRWREATRNFSSGILAALNGTSADGHRGKIYIPGRDIR